MKKKASKKVLKALARGRAILKSKRKKRKNVSKVKPIIIKELSGMKTKRAKKASKRRKTRRVTAVHGFGIAGSKKRRTRRVHSRRKSYRMHGESTKKEGIGDMVMGGAGVVAGVIGASAIAKMVPVSNPKIKSLVPIALGIGLMSMNFGRKGFAKHAAEGSVAIGILSLVKQFMPQLPLMGEEYYGIAYEGEEAAILGLPYNGEMEGVDYEGADIEGEGLEMQGDELSGIGADAYISPDDL